MWRIGQVPENWKRANIVPALKKMEKGTLKKPWISQPNFKQAITGKNKLEIIIFVNDTVLEGTGNTIAPQLELVLLVNQGNYPNSTRSRSLK